MKAAKKTMLMDGAKVAYTHGQYGKKVAEITSQSGNQGALQQRNCQTCQDRPRNQQQCTQGSIINKGSA